MQFQSPCNLFRLFSFSFLKIFPIGVDFSFLFRFCQLFFISFFKITGPRYLYFWGGSVRCVVNLDIDQTISMIGTMGIESIYHVLNCF